MFDGLSLDSCRVACGWVACVETYAYERSVVAYVETHTLAQNYAWVAISIYTSTKVLGLLHSYTDTIHNGHVASMPAHDLACV